MNDRNAVTDDDIQSVVDGFKHYIARAAETSSFDVEDMKNYMEPIFERAGFRSTRDGENKAHILLLHEAAAGDFVMMSAAIREIRRIYPTAYITLVVESRVANLAECCPYIDDLIDVPFKTMPKTFTSIFDADLKTAQQLLKRRFDLALAFAYSVVPNVPLLAYMSGAKRRVTHHGGLWEPLVTEFVPPIIGKYQAIDVNLKYVEYLLGAPIVNREVEVWIDESDLESVKSMLPSAKKLCAIGLGGSFAKNHYPPEYYAELMKMILRADGDVKFVLLGGSTDIDDAKIVTANVDPKCVVDLVGKTTFRQTTAALSFCELYIGNDTSAMHLAAATDTPVLNPNPLALDLHVFPNSRDHWTPRDVPSVIVCPSHALPECRGSTDFRGCRFDYPHCITQITPQNLFDAYKILLERSERGIKQPLIVGAK